jgi:Zn-dependent peptidase ImmA (M78 family)
VPLKVRPMLVSGMLAKDDHGPVILINSEDDPKEQVRSLWHETLHLLGLTDEFLVEEYAMALADAVPGILRKLAHNINVPDANAPASASGLRELAERCRPAVAAYLRARDRDTDNPMLAHYGEALKADAERTQKLLDDIDALIGQPQQGDA